MNTQNWLTLMDYSAQHRVSMSTLRRRIKSGEIEFKFIEGKYLLKNEPLQLKAAGPETIAPPTQVSAHGTPKSSVQDEAAPALNSLEPVQPASSSAAEPRADQFWEITQGLLSEIKHAFNLVLHEKEASLTLLKGEISDLRTLVRVLEQENEKLKVKPRALVGADFDLGFDI